MPSLCPFFADCRKQSQREGTGEGIMDLNKAFRGLSSARQTVTFDQHEIIATDPETNAATVSYCTLS